MTFPRISFAAAAIILASITCGCRPHSNGNAPSTEKGVADTSTIVRNADGTFIVTCRDGARETATEQQIRNNDVCGRYQSIALSLGEGDPIKLEDLVRNASSTVTVFQWCGLVSLRSADVAKSFAKAMSEQIQNHQLSHVLVFDDARGDYEDSSFQYFQAEMSPASTVVHDWNAQERRKLDFDNNRPLDTNRPAIVIDKNLTKRLLWVDSSQELVDAASSMLIP